MKHLIFTLVLLTFGKLYAQPGTFDKSFAGDGLIIDSVYAKGDMVIQPDQKILVATGGPFNEASNGFKLSRYLPDGSLDAEFGEGGISKLNNEGGIRSIVLLPDGKILAGGSYTNMILAKYLPDGTLDSTFGANGQVYYEFPGVPNAGMAEINLQSDGKIIVAGVAAFEFQRYALLARFDANGIIDKTFGNGDGFLLEKAIRAWTSLLIQPDDHIIVGGSTPLEPEFAVARFMPGGTADSSFGINGLVLTSFNEHREELYDLALQPDGKIVAAGISDDDFGPVYSKMAMVRYNTDGSLDETFGENGAAFAGFKDTSAQGRKIALQPDGSVVLTGEKSNQYSFSIPTVVKFTRAGKIDASFGENGFAFIAVGEYDNINAVELQPDNKILVSGLSLVSSPDTAVFTSFFARLNNNINPKQAIITKIKRWIQNRYNGIVWQNAPGTKSYTIERSTNGINWQSVSSRQFAANQQTPVNYYEDASPASGTNYYRVQTTSADNATTVSNVIAITNNEDDVAAAISLYPNPVKDVLHIKGLNQNTSYGVKVTNENGNVVTSSTITNRIIYNFNVQRLKKGIYYVKMTCGNVDAGNVAIKFLKD